MRRLGLTITLLFVVIAVVAPFASAATTNTYQYYPLPAATPKTEVTCGTAAPTSCTGTYLNAPSVGYDGAITKFTGRLLDSTIVGDWQSYMRTLRAWQFKYDKVKKRFYFRIGSTLGVYDAARMVSRLSSGADRTIASVANRPPSGQIKGEKYLLWDSFFYAEDPNTGWGCPYIDGQDRMPSLDYDDRGNIYLAYSIFGWGIAKDDVTYTGGPILSSIVQVANTSTMRPTPSIATPTLIMSVKSTNGTKYWAIVGASGIGTSDVWDVTNPASPTFSGVTISRAVTENARSDDGQSVAVYDREAGSEIFIYTPDGLATNQQPIFRSANSGYKGVTTDGVNYYSVRTVSGALVVSIFSPVGGGNFTETTVPTGVGMSAPQTCHFNDNYLTVIGSNDLEVFRVSGSSLTRLDLKAYASSTNLGNYTRYFNRYYAKCGLPPCSDSIPSGFMQPDITNFIDAMVFVSGGKTYLLGDFRNLADVYEIRGADGVALATRGVTGTTNPYSKQTASGPFYGDKITFGSSTTAAAPFNVNWDFGNGEAPDNTTSSTTGADVTHQYSGLTSTTQLTPRIVKVSSATDSSVSDSTTVTMATPTPRFGVKGTTLLFLQPNASSSAPIVSSDEFTDDSDGTVEGHYTSWTIDNALTKGIPSATVPVGACGDHSLNFAANYGPYFGSGSTLASSNGAISLGINPFAYHVRPFAAVINTPTSDATNVTFTSGSRADTTLAQSNPSFTYTWDLLNSAGSSVLTATGSSTIGSVPAFVVPRSSFTGLTGAKVRLRLAIANTALLAPACQGSTSDQTLTGPLNAPDPQIVKVSGCDYAGSPCNLTAVSTSSADMSGWNYSWSVTSGSAGGTAKDYSPTFASSGSFTVTLNVTNAIGNGSASFPLTIQSQPCIPPSQGDIAVSYFSGSNCYPGGTCTTGDTITYRASSFTYVWKSSCDQYLWTFGDNTSSTSFSPTHKYSANGTYNGSFKLTVGGTVLTYNFQVIVGSTPTGCQTNCGGPTGGSCTTLTDAGVFISYNGTTQSCSSNATSPSCKTNEVLAFQANPNAFAGYSNFLCTTHSFTWNFGDGQTGTGQQLNHTYTTAGSYIATLDVVATGYGSAHVQVPVTVTGGSTGTCAVAPSSSNMTSSFTGVNCSSANGATCNSGDTLTFTASPGAGFDASCNTYSWDFGDGSGTVNGQTVQHAYNANQSQYTARVTITNNVGSVQLTQTVKVQSGTQTGGACQQPTTSNLFLTFNAPSGCSYTTNQACKQGEAISFNVAINTFSSAGYTFTCGTHTFNWNFGDGQTASGQSPSHTYATKQAYTVTCTVTNPKGTVTLSIPVNVEAPIQGNTVDFAYEAVTGAPTLIKFTPTVTPVNSASSWTWSFGDSTSNVTLSGTSATPQYHQFATAGTYTVTLTTNVGSVTKQVPVNVTPPPPRNRPTRHGA